MDKEKITIIPVWIDSNDLDSGIEFVKTLEEQGFCVSTNPVSGLGPPETIIPEFGSIEGLHKLKEIFSKNQELSQKTN